MEYDNKWQVFKNFERDGHGVPEGIFSEFILWLEKKNIQDS